ncbi:MAG: hypothetical protein CL927_07745 [Deltaproteobacteria bacterium]|nr:hypothetical protein [Deltaproteobacteria bacterium]HCH65956.1 hypothetical protein [Deltaproteobacteria bacterium]
MSAFSRRNLLCMGSATGVGLGLRSALTGLPVSFLLRGEAHADAVQPRVAILASSSEGEPINVCGPGTYEQATADSFTHPDPNRIELEEVNKQDVNGVVLGVESLSQAAEITLGVDRIRMAACFAALPSEMLRHLVWFNYRSGANIHPQYKDVLSCFGQVRGGDGRGDEQLPAAIAQELSGLLGTTTAAPLILGTGAFTSSGSSLANYSPMKLKTLTESVGQAIGGADNFAAMYDTFIDEAYRDVLRDGTAQQKRFFDQHAASRREATEFGSALGTLLAGIEDDSIKSQMETAAIVAKLRLAPVVVINTDFGGDNHQDAGLLAETNQTLAMIDALNEYWTVIEDYGVKDDVFFANLDVFGRDPSSDGNGRSHYGDFVSGLIVGTHLQGGVVGGWQLNGKVQATGINATTGSPLGATIAPEDTLAAYYRTLLQAAGVSPDRQEVRLPTGTPVSSVMG